MDIETPNKVQAHVVWCPYQPRHEKSTRICTSQYCSPQNVAPGCVVNVNVSTSQARLGLYLKVRLLMYDNDCICMYLSDLYSTPSTNAISSWICTKRVLKQYLKGKKKPCTACKKDEWSTRQLETIVLIFEELRMSHLNDAYFSCFPYSIFFIWIPMFMIPRNR